MSAAQAYDSANISRADLDTDEPAYQWVMPDSGRNFHVEVDDDGNAQMLCGFCWTVRAADYLTPEESAWVAPLWPEILASVRHYSAEAQR